MVGRAARENLGEGMRIKSVALIAAAAAAVATPLAVMAAAAVVKLPLPRASTSPSRARSGWRSPSRRCRPRLRNWRPSPCRGYQVQLVASDPLIQDPMIAEFDGDGRLWVLEEKGWGINSNSDNTRDPVNDVAILEDTDNDGVYDKKTIFLDKLVLPRALKVLDGGCALIGTPPNVTKACDTNGDLKADTRTIAVANGFAVNLANSTGMEHGGNGLFWGMDNLLRLSEQANDISFKDGAFKLETGLSRGQWGITQDNGGRIYRNVNTDALFVDYLPARYFLRNPDQVRTNGLYQSLVNPDTIADLAAVAAARLQPRLSRRLFPQRQHGALLPGRLLALHLSRHGAAQGYPEPGLRGRRPDQHRPPLEADRHQRPAVGDRLLQAGRVPGLDQGAVPPGADGAALGRQLPDRRHVSRRLAGRPGADRLYPRLYRQEEADRGHPLRSHLPGDPHRDEDRQLQAQHEQGHALPSWSSTSRTSMAGGATRRRRPWCSAATARSSRPCGPSPGPRRKPIPVFRRCGRWMAWAASNRPM